MFVVFFGPLYLYLSHTHTPHLHAQTRIQTRRDHFYFELCIHLSYVEFISIYSFITGSLIGFCLLETYVHWWQIYSFCWEFCEWRIHFYIHYMWHFFGALFDFYIQYMWPILCFVSVSQSLILLRFTSSRALCLGPISQKLFLSFVLSPSQRIMFYLFFVALVKSTIFLLFTRFLLMSVTLIWVYLLYMYTDLFGVCF